LDDRTSTCGDATGAGLGAFAPGAPNAHLAIRRAGLGVAKASLAGKGAGSTAVRGSLLDGTSTLLLASAARLGAGVPASKVGHGAVSRAQVNAAASNVLQGRAAFAALGGGNEDLAGNGLGAQAAGLGAGTGTRPRANLAVGRADGVRARLDLALLVARKAAEGSGGKDDAAAGLDTTTARAGAGTVLAPSTEDAVLRAFVGVALVSLDNGRALLATV